MSGKARDDVLSGMGKGALAGSAVSLLFGTKKGRKLGKTVTGGGGGGGGGGQLTPSCKLRFQGNNASICSTIVAFGNSAKM